MRGTPWVAVTILASFVPAGVSALTWTGNDLLTIAVASDERLLPIESAARQDLLAGVLDGQADVGEAQCPAHLCLLFQSPLETYVPSDWAVAMPAAPVAAGGAGGELGRSPLAGRGQIATTALAVSLGVLGLIGLPCAYAAWRLVPGGAGGRGGRYGLRTG